MESSCRLSHLSVCLSVCVRKVYCGKTADWMVTGVGRGMGVLDGVVIVEGKGQFGGEFGTSH